jgi:acyl-CoA synthetase (AMP-forming)/AMP-acid ligase II
VNTYGPTEAAIVATGFVAAEEGAGPGATGSESAPAAGDGEVPIGRPLPHVYIRILDAHRREVPAGLPGELYIGGVGVARGYLNRPELTERSFLPDPFASAPSSGARLYKTGDLCRVREDGEIDYLGRADNQVKLRGFRIELDEVENAVSGHPGVAESVVVPVLEGGRVSALAAYAVPRVRDLTVAALKEHLASRLPKYAVPAHILLLDRLPLTANGKVDRRALPKPESPAAGDTRGAGRRTRWRSGWPGFSPRRCGGRRWGWRKASRRRGAIPSW